jgi:signal transduction histidine kinase
MSSSSSQDGTDGIGKKNHIPTGAELNTVFTGVQVLEAVKNKDGKVVDFTYKMVSNSVNHSLGRDLGGKSLTREFPDVVENGFFEKLSHVMATGNGIDEITHISADGDGKDKWFHVTAQQFDGGIILAREDISKLKKAEDDIHSLNKSLNHKNRELESLYNELRTFNSIAANDYKETLRHLYTALEFIVNTDAKNLSDASKANVRRAQASIQKMKLLTDDIVSYLNVTTSSDVIGEVNLEKIIVAAHEDIVKKYADVHISLHLPALPALKGSPRLIALLFFNLFDNAVKFRHEGKDAILEVEYSTLDGKSLEHPDAMKDSLYHVITVSDDGIGFDKTEHEKIFTMFYRLHDKGKYRGSGIGLSICKRIMELHGGFISAECVPNCTRFHCYFPQ